MTELYDRGTCAICGRSGVLVIRVTRAGRRPRHECLRQSECAAAIIEQAGRLPVVRPKRRITTA